MLPGVSDFLLTYGEPGERVPDKAESRPGFGDLGSKSCWVCRPCGTPGVLRAGAMESAGSDMRGNRGLATIELAQIKDRQASRVIWVAEKGS